VKITKIQNNARTAVDVPNTRCSAYRYWGCTPNGRTTRGDDTKVRKLSGSRSCCDARALSNSKLEHDFRRAPEAAKVRAYRKILFRDRNQAMKRNAFHLGTTTRCPSRSLPAAQSVRIHVKRLKLSNWVLSNRTILTLNATASKQAGGCPFDTSYTDAVKCSTWKCN
jgi:hypothetical protein